MNSRILVSVVVPTYNGKKQLRLLLESLENQSIKPFEVIIVDDGSTDGTRKAVEGLIRCYPVPLSYYYLNNTAIFGAGIARNHGAKQAKGTILLFLDQDCVAERDLIQKHVEHHKTKDIILGYFAGYGHEKKCYDIAKLEDYVQERRPIPVIKEFRDQLFKNAAPDDAWKCFVSAHFSIKRKIFNNFYFDENFIQWGGQDVDLGYQLFKAGHTISFEKDCVVYNSCKGRKHTKKKILALSKSLIYTYKKYQTEEIKLYCLERFYHTQLEHRGKLQLRFKNNKFTVEESQTKILITDNGQAIIVAGSDFTIAADVIEQIIPLINSIFFDIAIIKNLKKLTFLSFQNTFYKLIRILRDSKKHIDLNAIRTQSFLMGIRFLAPEQLSIDFHNKCNIKCLFCPIHTPFKTDTPKEYHSLSLSLVENILEQAYEMGVQSIRFVPDGEPLISPDIYAILDSIVKKGFALNIVTNLTMLNKKHLLLLSKIQHLSFLINFSATKKSTYQKLYKGHLKNYDSVLKALSWLSKLKNKRRMRNEAMLLHTTFVITNLNYLEISEYVLLCKRFGIDHIYFKFAILYEETKDLLLSQAQLKECRKEVLKAISFADKLFISTTLKEILMNIDDKGFRKKRDIKQHTINLPSNHCYNGWFFAKIDPYGDYYICCRGSVKIGNVHKKEFKDIFFSRKMTNVLNEGASGISLDKKMWQQCNYCYHLQFNKKAREWLKQE